MVWTARAPLRPAKVASWSASYKTRPGQTGRVASREGLAVGGGVLCQCRMGATALQASSGNTRGCGAQLSLSLSLAYSRVQHVLRHNATVQPRTAHHARTYACVDTLPAAASRA